MPNWYSPQKLAGLQGMPKTVQGIWKRAKQENWPSRERKGKGGGREYPFSCLPQATQAALLKKAVARVAGAFAGASEDKQGQALAVLAAAGEGLGLVLSDAPSPPAPLPQAGEESKAGGALVQAGEGRPAGGVVSDERPAGKPSGGKAKLPALRQSANDALSQRQILSRDARLLVVRGIERLIKEQTFSVRAACQQLCDWVKAGEVDAQVMTALALGHSKSGLEWAIKVNKQGQPVAQALPGQDVVAKAKTVSRRTLERWVAASREGDIQALAPQVRRQDMSNRLKSQAR